MGRLKRQMEIWFESGVPTIVGGDFNVIPRTSTAISLLRGFTTRFSSQNLGPSIARCSGSIQL
jgi:hypothetical protein